MSGPGSPRRVGHLLGMSVLSATGERLGMVKDVRVTAPAGTAGYGGLVVAGLVVGQRDVGSRLGYDRRRQQGPLLIRLIVGFLHRDDGYIAWEAVTTVDWEGRRVLLGVDVLARLEQA